MNESIDDILERNKKRSKQLVRSPKKRRANKSPTKLEKVKENTEDKLCNEKTVEDRGNDSENAGADTSVSEANPPVEESGEWDYNTTLESVDIKLHLSPEHSAESGSGK